MGNDQNQNMMVNPTQNGADVNLNLNGNKNKNTGIN